MQSLETRSEVKFKVTVTQLWYATLRHPKMHPHTKSEIPNSNNLRYMLQTRLFLKLGQVKVKVTVTRKWYATLCHPKMYPHTKFGILTSKNIGDMHRTRSRTAGLTVRLLYASQSYFGGIKIYRNTIRLSLSNNLDQDQAQHHSGPDLGPNCLHRLSAD